jgi:uncharacterized protein (TIGR03086 family)
MDHSDKLNGTFHSDRTEMESTMSNGTSSWEVLTRAHQALRAAVSGVPDGSWSLHTPCAEWNVAQVLQHAAGDQLGYAAFLGHGQGPAFDPFAPSGTLDTPATGLLEPALEAAATAFSGVPSDATEVPVPLPQGPLPAAVAVGACALDAAVHAWDIAVATGQGSPLDDDLASELKQVAVQIVEPLRGFAYGPVLAGPTGAGTGGLADLLRYLGRDPGWAQNR